MQGGEKGEVLGQQQEQPLELAEPPEQKTLKFVSATPNLQNKTHLNLGSKGLWSSQSRINMGVLHVNLKTQEMRSGH